MLPLNYKIPKNNKLGKRIVLLVKFMSVEWLITYCVVSNQNERRLPKVILSMCYQYHFITMKTLIFILGGVSGFKIHS